MVHERSPRLLQCAVAATLLAIGVTACDHSTSDEEVARALPCNLADEECAALPVAADAFALLESMDIDLDETDVELVDDPSDVEAEDPADEPSIGALKAKEPPPQAALAFCRHNEGVTCCCFMGGGVNVCECG